MIAPALTHGIAVIAVAVAASVAVTAAAPGRAGRGTLTSRSRTRSISSSSSSSSRSSESAIKSAVESHGFKKETEGEHVLATSDAVQVVHSLLSIRL